MKFEINFDFIRWISDHIFESALRETLSYISILDDL